MAETLKDGYLDFFKKRFGSTSPRAAKKAAKKGTVLPGTGTGYKPPPPVIKKTGTGAKPPHTDTSERTRPITII
jgi:hypothetical protein